MSVEYLEAKWVTLVLPLDNISKPRILFKGQFTKLELETLYLYLGSYIEEL